MKHDSTEGTHDAHKNAISARSKACGKKTRHQTAIMTTEDKINEEKVNTVEKMIRGGNFFSRR